ncbi:MAG: putative porin [Flavobacteriaceae bacterium]|nr:putative porin [Flavobacteriaceae bacterium]
MFKQILFSCAFLTLTVGFSQIRTINNDAGFENRLTDSIPIKDAIKVKLSGKTKFTDYKIFSHKKDTTYIDTTLTIAKDYVFNFIRKDAFELLEFQNQGQTFNNLAYTFTETSLYPELGARAKHFSHFEVEDIKYYEVPTPTTELAWRTGLEQGQVLDALITLNTSKRQNISLSYKGLRSLGKYRNTLSSHGNMRLTYSYQSKKGNYNLRIHQTAQQIINDENGGLTPDSIIFFETNDPDFKERGRLVTNFIDATNILRSNRSYLEHDYAIWRRLDSLSNTKTSLKIGHVLNYETKHYEFNQVAQNDFFGNAFDSEINDKNKLRKLYNQVNVSLTSPVILGTLKLHLDNYNYNYRYQNLVNINNQTIAQSLNGNVSSFGADWVTYYKNIKIHAKAASTITNDLNANYIKATATYKKDSLFTINASFLNNSKSPNFNFLLNQSTYQAYNWQNSFKNELTRTLFFELKSDKWINATAQITQLDNYAYFTDIDNDGQIEPIQFNGIVNYLKIKVSKKIKFKKFTVDNTVMYQNVTNGKEVLRVPDFVTRNSLYYSSYVFKKKPMFLQTGITFKYFTKYFANDYNPLLSEFSVQNDTEIGNFPLIDLFVNAKIRQTRIYFKAEHLNSLFSKKNYYTAPTYPYRDFVIRFGLVWNFFI